MFPLEFPLHHLRRSVRGQWVLDPFCGRGSTNFAARLLGNPSVGIDSNPVAVAIAESKFLAARPELIVNVCRTILTNAGPTPIPKGAFWKACFHSTTLKQLCKLRHELKRNCESPTRKALRAILLGCLHGPLTKSLPSYCSNMMPRTYAAKPRYAVGFWKRHRLSPPPVDVVQLVSRKVTWYFGQVPPVAAGRIYKGDSCYLDIRTLAPEPFSWVITSPPYYGMRTYVPDQWLRFWFLGGKAKVTYDNSGQLRHSSPSVFIGQLATVWKNVGIACVPGARMIVRFGGIRDREQEPRLLMIESLKQADSGWKIQTVSSAGVASNGKRQADQFWKRLKSPIEELDFHVKLCC